LAACGPLVPSYPQSFPQIVWMVDNRRFDPPLGLFEGGPPPPDAHVVLQRTSSSRHRSAEWQPGFSSHNPRVRRRALSHVEGVDLLKIVQEAGWPIWPLILCSIAAVALIVERFMALRTARIAPGYLLGEVIAVTRNGLPSADVIAKLADNSLLGGVLASGLKLLAVDPRVGEVQLRQTFEGAGRDAAHKMDRYLNALGSIAAAAPLLGLFGTVVGMIEIFGSQGGGNTNPAELAHGISTALYNTAAGLIVAIPSLMFYRYFRGRVDDYLHTLEQSSEQLLTQLMRVTAGRPGQTK
jgi:biopolymer transport protein ExbB